MAVYGFIGADHRVEPDYCDLDMLSYRNKHQNYIPVTENTNDHTIEIRTGGTQVYLRGSETQIGKKRSVAQTPNQLQLNVMKKLVDYLETGDTMMFRMVQDLSHDKDYAAVIYKAFIQKDIQVEFLYDPSCDFSIYRKAYLDNPTVIDDIISKALSAALTIPESRKVLSVPGSQNKRQKSSR